MLNELNSLKEEKEKEKDGKVKEFLDDLGGENEVLRRFKGRNDGLKLGRKIFNMLGVQSRSQGGDLM